jgi:hypothetical protein
MIFENANNNREEAALRDLVNYCYIVVVRHNLL